MTRGRLWASHPHREELGGGAGEAWSTMSSRVRGQMEAETAEGIASFHHPSNTAW